MTASLFRACRAFYRLARLLRILGLDGTILFLVLAGKEGRFAMVSRWLLSFLFT